MSRLHMLPPEKIDTEMRYLQIAIDETAGPAEHETLGWPMEAVANFRAEGKRARVAIREWLPKGHGSLFDAVGEYTLQRFKRQVQRHGKAGLAGSLRFEHLPQLRRLRPDIAGFRGAVCEGRGVGGLVGDDGGGGSRFRRHHASKPKILPN